MDGASQSEEGAASSAPEQPAQTTDLLGLGESWADASEAPDPSDDPPAVVTASAEVEATLDEIAQDVQTWVKVKEEAGLDAEGQPLAEAEIQEGAAPGAPDVTLENLPVEAPELSSEPTVSVDEDRVASLPELELEEIQHTQSEETPIDSEETTAEGPFESTVVEGAASGAPAVEGVDHIDLEEEEDPEDEQSLPRPLTAGQSELRTGSASASGSQPPKEKKRGKRSGQQRQTRKQTKDWRTDWKVVADFLFKSTQRCKRGYTSYRLPNLDYSYANLEQRQLVSRFAALRSHFTENQLLILCGKVFRNYREYSDNNGYRGEGWQGVASFRRNNPVTSFAEAFSRVNQGHWIDPYQVIPGPALTLPKAAQIQPTPPDHPPPSWRPTLNRGTPATAERFSLEGAATSAPAPEETASFCAGIPPESAAPARTVYLSSDSRADEVGRIPKAVTAAVISEAKARGFDPATAIPPPPVDPPSVPEVPSDIPPPPTNRPPTPAEVARISQAVRLTLGEAESKEAVVVVKSPRIGTVVTTTAGSEITPPSTEVPVAEASTETTSTTEATPIVRSVASPRERQSKRPAEAELTPSEGAASGRSTVEQVPKQPSVPSVPEPKRGRTTIRPAVQRADLGRSRSAPLSQRSVTVTGRPSVLRPNHPGYPEVRIEGGRTWYAVGPAPAVGAPYPALVPHPFGPFVPQQHTDPYSLNQAAWQSPGIAGSQESILVRPNTEVFDLGPDDGAEELPGAEASDLTETPYERFTAEAPQHSLDRQQVEAPVISRPRPPPLPPTPKRSRARVVFTDRAVPSSAPQRVVTLEGAASGAPVNLSSAEQVAEREAREAEAAAQPIASAPAPPPQQAEPSPSAEAAPEVPDDPEPAAEPHQLEGTRAGDGTTYRTPPIRGSTTATPTEAPIVPKVLGTPVQASDPPEPEPNPSGQETPKVGAASGAPLPTSPKPGSPAVPEGYIGLPNLPNNPKAKPVPPFRGYKAPPGDLSAIARAREAANKAQAEAVAKAKAEAAKAKSQQIVHKGNTYWIQAPETATPEQVAQELEAARARIYGTEVPDDFTNSPPKPAPAAPSDNLARPHQTERSRNESVDRDRAYQIAAEERAVQERQQAWREATASERTRAWQQEVDQAAREGRQVHSPATAQGAASSAPSGSASSRQPSRPAPRPKPHPSINLGDQGVVKVVLDWHGVLDVDLTPLGTITPQGRRYFQQISQAAQGRVEFHILSFCGKNFAAENQANIDHFITDANQLGIPIVSGSIVFSRTEERGKAAVLSSIGAHCMVDDVDFIITECAKTKVFTIQVPRGSTDYCDWAPAVEDWIRRCGVDYILRNHRAKVLEPHEYVKDPRNWRNTSAGRYYRQSSV